MEQVIFVIVLLTLLGILLAMTYQTKSNLFGFLFIGVCLIGAAFYLFQYGALGTFSFKALSAEAKFIKEKAVEVKEDSQTINEFRNVSEKTAKEIAQILTRQKLSEEKIEKVKNNIFGIEGDFAKVKKGLVEIEYLQYEGRNIFPNPYHDRIIAKLNELLVIAIPNEQERNVYVKELSAYTQKQGK